MHGMRRLRRKMPVEDNSEEKMKRIICRAAALLLAAALFLPSCGQTKKRYSVTYTEFFDTVTNFTAYCASKSQFERASKAVRDKLGELHRLFDIYNEYDGTVNLATVNRLAGDGVPVPEAIGDLLSVYGLFWYDTGGLLDTQFASWDAAKYALFEESLWQTKSGKYIGLDHQTALGKNGMSLNEFYSGPSKSEGSNLDGGKTSSGKIIETTPTRSTASETTTSSATTSTSTSTTSSQTTTSATTSSQTKPTTTTTTVTTPESSKGSADNPANGKIMR
jgi:hypothetical protein